MSLSGNWSQPTATVFACLARSWRRRICHRLRPLGSIKAPSFVASTDDEACDRRSEAAGVCCAGVRRPDASARIAGKLELAAERIRKRVGALPSSPPGSSRLTGVLRNGLPWNATLLLNSQQFMCIGSNEPRQEVRALVHRRAAAGRPRWNRLPSCARRRALSCAAAQTRGGRAGA